jgi:hypothetical protein
MIPKQRVWDDQVIVVEEEESYSVMWTCAVTAEYDGDICSWQDLVISLYPSMDVVAQAEHSVQP